MVKGQTDRTGVTSGAVQYSASPRARVGHQFPRCLGFHRFREEIPLPIVALERPKKGELLSGFAGCFLLLEGVSFPPNSMMTLR
jgi:hypothetical protein